MIEPGVTILVGGAFLIGVLGFFVMMASLLLRAFRWAIRSLAETTPPPAAAELGVPPAKRTCPYADCAHDNPPAAIFCARCGRRLPEPYDGGGHG